MLEVAEDNSLSTAAAEYFSASTAALEVLYPCNLLESSDVYEDSNKDNTACIRLIGSPGPS